MIGQLIERLEMLKKALEGVLGPMLPDDEPEAKKIKRLKETNLPQKEPPFSRQVKRVKDKYKQYDDKEPSLDQQVQNIKQKYNNELTPSKKS